ncbi:Holliday junction resolvase RecU [Anaerotruncus colihominis]|uniref:Holliday junction resolvase RecU n=1 Tax=Anaerotruncus colihominis TaxID=169435 RepID=A0A845T0F0_9FIRM|nr:Holliday junction resolvase RecU [Anaerotruncus colihominis]MCR2026916.1 Holliday junction resolvase RecU [Anaerotruncus colihominis]NDO40334.1 recombinase [Anaerotruncus colihominis]
MVRNKDPKRQWQGAVSKARGRQFEEQIDTAFEYYRNQGSAIIEKTPEPMRPIKNLGAGKFIAFFERKAQPDYKGVIKGGQAVIFEAKFTSADRMEQSRVLQSQAEYLTHYQHLGARCFIVAGFASNGVYRLPWDVWRNMKERFGRKYITESDLQEYRVLTAQNGALLLLD